MSQTETNHPECIAKALKKLDKERQDILDLCGVADFVEKFIERFAPPGNRVYISAMLMKVRIQFKMAQLSEAAPILRELAKAGYRQTCKPVDLPECRVRIWHCGKIDLEGVFPYSEGEHCSFVQVGTKEEAVYELRCSNGEPETSPLDVPAETVS